jgi:hypothetical protein
VAPALTREALELDYLQQNTGLRAKEWQDWGITWYKGANNPEYIKWQAGIQHRLDVLQQGGHILDERGIILPEF